MDLDLDILSLRGRPAKQLCPRVVRALKAEDIELLFASGPEARNERFTLKKVSERHHALARALASGMKDWEASAVTGYVVGTIYLLKQDPTFQELLAFYRAHKDAEFRTAQQRMAALSVDAIDSLHDDLEEGKLKPAEKIEVAKLTLDRTGNGPASTTSHNHVHTVNVADRLSKAQKRLEERRIIDITPTEEKEDAA